MTRSSTHHGGTPCPASLAARLATLAAAALALGACGGTVDFSVDKNLEIDSTISAGSSTGSYDLAASAGSAWKQRKHISSVTIQSATATVTVVKPANTATTLSGSVWLLPEGATSPSDAGALKVGDWTNEAVAVGTVIDLPPSDALNGFIRDLFNGSGKFSIYAIGSNTGGNRVAVTLHVVLDAKLKWKVP